MVPALVDVHKGTSNNTAFGTCISSQSADRPFSRDARVLRPLVGATSPALERPGELPSLPARLPSLMPASDDEVYQLAVCSVCHRKCKVLLKAWSDSRT